MSNKKIWKRLELLVIIIFLLPFISNFVNNQWYFRFLSLTFVIYFAVPLICWYALNPNTKMIRKGGKLNEPGKEKAKKIVDRIARVFLLILAVGLFFLILVPLTIDNYNYYTQGDSYIVNIKDKVMDNSQLWGTWFIHQSIALENHEGKYYYFYSIKPRIKINQVTEFTILPKSKLILDSK